MILNWTAFIILFVATCALSWLNAPIGVSFIVCAIVLAPFLNCYLTYRQALTLVQKKSYDKAFDLLSKVISMGALLDRNLLAHSYLNRAYILMLRESFDSSIRECNYAIKLVPRYAYAFAYRGWANCRLNNYELAISDCQTCLELAPNSYYGHLYMGLVQTYNNEDLLALTSLNRALEINQKLPSLYENRAVILLSAGKFQDALEDCNTVIEKDQSMWAPFVNRAYVHLCLDNLVECANDLDIATVLAPDELYVLSNRARLCIAQNRLLDATELIGNRFENLPRTSRMSPLLCTQGMLFKAQGRLTDALKYFDKSLELYPFYREALWQRGDTLEKLGRIEEGQAIKSSAMSLGFLRGLNY